MTAPVALLTGSSRGIGLASALTLGAGGFAVCICARRAAVVDEAAARLADAGIDHLAIAADLTDGGSAARIVAAAVARWGRLDVLVNNVGGLPCLGTFLELDDQAWLDAFTLNTLSAVRFARAAIPHLRRSARGRIIQVSSVVGHQPGFANPHYAVAKAGMTTLGKHLSLILAADGIAVNTVTPGIIDTDAWKNYLRDRVDETGLPLAEVRAAEDARAAAGIPAGRLGTAEEVAALVAFLASEGAGYVSGVNIMVDGGKTRAV